MRREEVSKVMSNKYESCPVIIITAVLCKCVLTHEEKQRHNEYPQHTNIKYNIKKKSPRHVKN